MRKRILWAVLAAVVLVLLCLFWIGRIAPEREGTTVDPVANAPRDEPRNEVPAPPQEFAQLVADEAPDPPAIEHRAPKERGDAPAVPAVGRGSGPYRFTLDVTVVDGFDHPLVGAVVYLAPRLHRLDVAGVTDPAGRLALVWHGHLPDMDTTVAVAGPAGSWSGLVRVQSTADVPLALRLQLPTEKRFEDPAEIERRLLNRFHRPELERESPLNDERGDRAAGGRLPVALERAPALSRAGGEWLFVSDPAGSAEAALEEFLASWRELLRHRELGGITPVSSTQGDGARVVGSVLDVLGRPAVGALLAIGEDPAFGQHGTYTDDAGRYVLDDVRPGTWYVRAGGGEHGRASTFGSVFAGETVGWDFALEPGSEVAGELLDAQSAPLADAWIELVGEEPGSSWNDFARTDENGRFVFHDVGDGARELRVHPRLPVRTGTAPPNHLPSFAVTVDVESRFAALRDPGLATGQLLMRFPEGERTDDDQDVVEARVWQLETRRGVFALPSRGRAQLFLPPGAYLVELGSARRGWTERRVQLAAGESQKVDLHLPAGGSVAWIDERAKKTLDYRLIELRDDVNSLVATFSDRLPQHFALPAGQYELQAVENGVAAHAIPFPVEDGRETVVTLVTQ